MIAVALFAALSYAVTQSGRGSGNIEGEQQMLDIAVMNQCQASIENGITRLKLLNNCSRGNVSYELADGTNENPNNPADSSCFLFHEDGANITPCGIYTEALAGTGTMTSQDTTTISVMPNGLYLSCPSWPYAWRCALQGSITGASFAPMFCIDKGALSNIEAAVAVGDEICNSMCGGTYSGGALVAPDLNQVTHAMKTNLSLSTDTASCDFELSELQCDCW